MQVNEKSPRRSLGVFRLIMITVISVDSIRNIPIAAQYGTSLISFYLVAGLCFFLPLILVTSRFASQYPNTGGSYLWIEAAFGKKIGFVSIWLQWVYQIIWYPTIFAFIASTIASLIHPAWETNQWFILSLCLLGFWVMTFISSYGVKAMSWVSSVGSIVGTLLPMVFVILLAGVWLGKGHASATAFTASALIPNQNALNNLGFFANILFSLLGLEVAAMHAGNVKTPEKTYRKAMIIAGIVILASLIFSSLALCTVISPAQIGLINGLMAAFKILLDQAGLGKILPFVGIAIVLGGLGIAFSWIIGLARGLQVACTDARLFSPLQKLNQRDMPGRILVLQGVIYSLLVSVFLIFPNVNNSYWMLSALTSQFALIYYVFLFCAVIKLCGGKQRFGIGGLLPVLAILTSLVGIAVGFLPPSNLSSLAIVKYELLIVGGLLLFSCPLIYVFRKIIIKPRPTTGSPEC